MTTGEIATVGTVKIQGVGALERRSAKGKLTGYRLPFAGKTEGAAALRKAGKELGLKGDKLSEYVNAHLRGDAATAAWVKADATLSALRGAGACPVLCDANKAGTAFTLKLAMPEEEKVAAPVVNPVNEALVAALKARGATEAEIAAIVNPAK